MAFQILLSLVLAVVWALLNNHWSLSSLVMGYIIGTVFLYIFRKFLPSEFYMRRVWAVIKLILLFNKELALANLSVVRHVLRAKMDIRPGIFALPTDLKTSFEITLLANLITLTPGTLTVDVSKNNDVLYIHAIDIPDVEQAIREIKGSFEKQIMEVTR